MLKKRLKPKYIDTNWDHFRFLVNKRLTLEVPLKTEEDIEAAVKFFMTQYNGQA
jgi:hypothetical protein